MHYAALPQYRGRANVNWAIINGEPETAITIHAIAPGLDDGKTTLFQQAIEIGPDDTAADIYSTLNEIQREVLGETVARYLEASLVFPRMNLKAPMDAAVFQRTARLTGQNQRTAFMR